MRAVHPFFLLPVCLLLAGCEVDRSGLAGIPPDEFDVVPNLVCRGEMVEISWTLNGLSRSRENCSAPDGGYDSAISCTTSSECPEDGSCVDGMCLRPGVERAEVDFGDGCLPNTSFTVFATPSRPLSTPVSGDTRPSGTENAVVGGTTDFTGIATLSPGGTRRPMSRAVEVVDTDLTTPKTIIFPAPSCGDTAPSTSVDLERLPDPILASDRVEIVRVTNRSGYRVTVQASDPDRGPMDLAAGETTEALNGAARGIWSVSPIELEPGPLPQDCVLRGGELPPPPVLDLELLCVRPIDE